MSLKNNLNQLIKERGQITLRELEDYCHKAQFKLATAERVLRKSISPDITPVWNEKGFAIIGYKYNKAESKIAREFREEYEQRTPKLEKQVGVLF